MNNDKLEYYKVIYWWEDWSNEFDTKKYVAIGIIAKFKDEVLTYEECEEALKLHNEKAMFVKVLTWLEVSELGYKSLKEQLENYE